MFVEWENPIVFAAAFIDACFACNADLSTQLRHIIWLMDEKKYWNRSVPFSEVQRKRRSVLAAELYEMVLGFVNAFEIQKTLADFLDGEVPGKFLRTLTVYSIH